jgi:hypothetical protein
MSHLAPLVLSAAKSGIRSVVTVSLVLGVLSSGCTTFRSVPVPAPGPPGPAAAVQVGDEVHARLRNGEQLAFTVTAIEPDTLVGKDVRVKFQDMGSLQVKRFAPVRTGGAVIGGAATILLVAFLVVAATGGMAFMPGGP